VNEESAVGTTPEERRAYFRTLPRREQYELIARRYQEIKAELMATCPHKTEAECGNRALEEVDEEYGLR